MTKSRPRLKTKTNWLLLADRFTLEECGLCTKLGWFLENVSGGPGP